MGSIYVKVVFFILFLSSIGGNLLLGRMCVDYRNDKVIMRRDSIYTSTQLMNTQKVNEILKDSINKMGKINTTISTINYFGKTKIKNR